MVVGAVILNRKGEMFLAVSAKWNNEWIIPRGHLELGETLHDAVKREVKEETNLDVDEIELIGVKENIFPEQYPVKRHFIFIDFCC
ncbi:MAG: NUDIX domain-containing protein, partial [archaeon]|nr:NUDIX domain-containing protein [archaeon]